MKIGVDAGCLGVKDKRLQVGVYQVTFNLLRELGKIGRQNEYLLYSFYPVSSEVMAQLGPKMTNIVVRPAFGWNYFALPLRLIKERPKVFLGPNQSLPIFCPCPSVVIVYDLAFEHYPEFYPDSYRKLKKMTYNTVNRAQQIIAISESTKNDLMRLYQTPSKKIKVVYPGYNKEIFKKGRDLSKDNYFLFVGALKRIKNIPVLMRGFSYFLEKSKKRYNLVLVGSDFWLDPQIKPTITQLKLEKMVKILGYVPTKKLVGLYQQATAFISPSFYEGFGLTLLEAAACGCPVIAGNKGAVPEVIGNAGILLQPDNPQEIGQAMLKVVGDQRLRSEMIKKGLERTKYFSWEKFAQGVFKIIESF